MDYSIKQMAVLAGISTRTLRYYHQIGLLKPKTINSSGYRIYGSTEVDKLFQILLYRQLDIPLYDIKLIMISPRFDSIMALEYHLQKLIEKKEYLTSLIDSVKLTIKSKKEGVEMTDSQKFKVLKSKNLAENEQKYGQELRQKYGEKVINQSNAKYSNMSEKTYTQAQKLESDILEYLFKAMDQNDYKSDDAKKAFELHKEWIMIYWNDYSSSAHRDLADIYISDNRFKDYYDAKKRGTAEFLRNIIYHFSML